MGKGNTKNIIKKKLGRPTKIDEETVKKLVSILQLGVSDTLACQYANISREAFYNRLEKDYDFVDKIETAKNYATIAAGQVVVGAIVKDKDIKAAMWWLERKHPEEFARKPEVVVNTQVNVLNAVEDWRKDIQ